MHPDHLMMAEALNVAAQALGSTWPNPSVGCVIASQGVVLARAHTARGGRPHAETQALDKAGQRARGATAYVTLEPCAHFGVTPPCANALIDARVDRVVIAALDHDPRVAGTGMQRLKDAGISVVTGVLERQAEILLRPFFFRLREKIPYLAADDGLSFEDRFRYDARVATDPTVRNIQGFKPSGRLEIRVPTSYDPQELLRLLSDSGLISVLINREDPLVFAMRNLNVVQPPVRFSEALGDS